MDRTFAFPKCKRHQNFHSDPLNEDRKNKTNSNLYNKNFFRISCDLKTNVLWLNEIEIEREIEKHVCSRCGILFQMEKKNISVTTRFTFQGQKKILLSRCVIMIQIFSVHKNFSLFFYCILCICNSVCGISIVLSIVSISSFIWSWFEYNVCFIVGLSLCMRIRQPLWCILDTFYCALWGENYRKSYLNAKFLLVLRHLGISKWWRKKYWHKQYRDCWDVKVNWSDWSALNLKQCNEIEDQFNYNCSLVATAQLLLLF